MVRHIEQLEDELQTEKDTCNTLRNKLEVQAEAALEERHRHEEVKKKMKTETHN